MHDLTDFIHNGYKPCGKKCDSSKNSVKSQRYVIFSVTDRENITYVGIALALHRSNHWRCS